MEQYNPLKLENQLCFPLYAAAREVVKQYHPFLKELDLTYTQYIAMMVFWEERSVSVRDLGRKLFLDSGTLTPVLKSLEGKGYITRARSKDDERVLVAKVTESGMKLREQALRVPQQIAGCIKLSEADAIKLYEILYTLLGSFSE